MQVRLHRIQQSWKSTVGGLRAERDIIHHTSMENSNDGEAFASHGNDFGKNSFEIFDAEADMTFDQPEEVNALV